MNGKSILIASICILCLVIAASGMSQELTPDLTGTWVSTYTGKCFDPIEGKTREEGDNWTIYIDDNRDGTFNATIQDSSETVYFGRVTSDPENPDKGAVVFIKCNIDDSLTIYRSQIAWGMFNIKKDSLDVTSVAYYTSNTPDIWEACTFRDRYTRINTDIPFDIGPCQP